MADVNKAQIEAEKAMANRVLEGGLADFYGDENLPEDIHITGFMILPVYVYDDEDGSTREGVGIWSDSSSHIVKLGILEIAKQSLSELYDE